MFCPRCESPVPDGANFCMRCGNPMTRERPQPAAAAAAAGSAIPQMPAAPAALRNNQLTPYMIMGLLILVIFLLGYGVSTLQAKAQPGPEMEAVHRRKNNLIATAQPLPGMPPSVHDWLEHLRRIEEQKNKLAAEQVAEVKTYATKFQALGPAAGLLSNPDSEDDNTNPTVPVQQMTTDMSKPWNDLIKDYQSLPPPPECQKLADEYFSGLNEIPAEMSDIQDLLSNLSKQMSTANPSSGESPENKDALKKAEGMQGKSSQDIDTHFTNSDELLGEVCNKYNTRKWFSISSDMGGGLLSTPF